MDGGQAALVRGRVGADRGGGCRLRGPPLRLLLGGPLAARNALPLASVPPGPSQPPTHRDPDQLLQASGRGPRQRDPLERDRVPWGRAGTGGRGGGGGPERAGGARLPLERTDSPLARLPDPASGEP